MQILHYFLHFGFIGVLAFVFFRDDWKKAYLILLATMLVDLDHLVADPIFQANRISIGYHFLHTHYAILIYIGMIFLPRPYNIIGVGLLFHMITDFIDGLYMFAEKSSLYIDTPTYNIMRWIFDFFS